MRVTQPGQARAMYYDRNATHPTLTNTQNGIAPHGLTTRTTYTVPANRKAQIDSVLTMIVRRTAAAPSAEARAFINTNFGSGPVSIVEAYLDNNTVGASDKGFLAQAGIVNAGDIITAEDIDNSTGGTETFVHKIRVTEFDA